ncbi:MAG: hypothetical protein ACLSAH_00860 [Bilophila wadsworthia]
MNINGTSGTPGLNVNELFNSGLDSISSKGKDLQAKMTEMLGKDEVSPEDMMAQFEVGQYNAMLDRLVRHEEHDGYDEEPCPAYRLSLSPVRNHVPGPHPGCFAWLHPALGASDGMTDKEKGLSPSPLFAFSRGCPSCPHLFTIGETPCCPIPRSAVCLMSPTLHVTEETWWMRVPCTRCRAPPGICARSWARP